jgi:hypothetical protein
MCTGKIPHDIWPREEPICNLKNILILKKHMFCKVFQINKKTSKESTVITIDI